MKPLSRRRIELHRTEMIRRPPGEVYRFWKDLTNLRQLMDERIQVEPLSATRTHWAVRAPGRAVQWDAELVADEPNRRIAWRSLPGGDVTNAGSVTFEPSENGEATVAALTFEVDPPGGRLGAFAGRVVRQTLDQEIAAMLHRLKARIESEGPIP